MFKLTATMAKNHQVPDDQTDHSSWFFPSTSLWALQAYWENYQNHQKLLHNMRTWAKEQRHRQHLTMKIVLQHRFPVTLLTSWHELQYHYKRTHFAHRQRKMGTRTRQLIRLTPRHLQQMPTISNVQCISKSYKSVRYYWDILLKAWVPSNITKKLFSKWKQNSFIQFWMRNTKNNFQWLEARFGLETNLYWFNF